jgi:hypothetical protein
MNFGLVAGAEAVPMSASASRLVSLDKLRSRCGRKQRASAADEIEQAVRMCAQRQRFAVVRAAREFNSVAQPLTSFLIPA